ncbi:sugar-transfer associated ATP-grasp domain-containing protein [Rubrolithibacter danxiaensis]|uniref:sugar-transfer associated ATP-grasp domain-containing protein n=1 Tax=Rubrolithibacter danxiaensis TaxID=3390805 RepID=UPI003BF7A729
MNVNKLRQKNLLLFEDLIFTVKCSLGRFTSLISFIRNQKTYVAAKSYFPEQELKSKRRIFYEQFLHILKHGETNEYYFLFGRDRKDTPRSRYLSRQKFIHLRDKVNLIPPKSENEYKIYNFVCLLQDKFTFGAFCRGNGVKTPVNIAIIENGLLNLFEKKAIVPLEELENLNIDTFCKLVTGDQGKGLFHLKISEKTIFMDGKPVTIQELRQVLGQDKWIVQEKIADQHEEINKLYQHSINTIRIMTVNTGSSVEVLGAVLRMGTDGRKIDNWSAGGIIVAIDFEKSELTKWGYYKPGYGTKVDAHPDTKVKFEQFKIPFIEEVVKEVKYLHSLLYGIHSIGWDVAITKDGPLFIEGNDNWGVTIFQLIHGESKQAFQKYLKIKSA